MRASTEMRPAAVPREVQLLLPPGTKEPRPDGAGPEQRAGRKRPKRDGTTAQAMQCPPREASSDKGAAKRASQNKDKGSSPTTVRAVCSPTTAATPRLGTATEDGRHAKKDMDNEADEVGGGTTAANRAATVNTVFTARR